ncbi:MAG: tetratricopeptide repeat protein [Flavobacteriaceae bacterium]|nr:tetratricopeptide repeat protein [Flavobacteriaceae bacterium]
MATYKKRATKKAETAKQSESTTEEVFTSLDSSAGLAEGWVSKNQQIILSSILGIVVIVLGYLAYRNFMVLPKSEEANNEMFQAQKYLEQGLADESLKDSLFNLALNGGEGKYGFLDIIENYSGTDAADLAEYNVGMIYLQLDEFELAIDYLEDFSSNDPVLKALALGGIGDAFSELNQKNDALDYYKKALNFSDNSLTKPRFLRKAGLVALDLGSVDLASEYFSELKDGFEDSPEAKNIDALLGMAQN